MSMVNHLLRRAFARLIDFSMWLVFWNFLYLYLLKGTANRDLARILVDQFVAIILMFLSEVVFIVWCGTTIGKKLLGLSVVHSRQGKLNMKQSSMRALYVWRHAYGFGIPYYRLLCFVRVWHNRNDREISLFKSRKDGIVVQSEAMSRWRWITLIITISILISALWYLYFVAWKC